MDGKFDNWFPLSFLTWNFLSPYYFYNNFSQKFAHFRVKFLEKFEAAKTGRGVIFAFERCEGYVIAPLRKSLFFKPKKAAFNIIS